MVEPTATVLIVDDDAASRAVLRLACELSGHVVVEASNGTEALTAAAAGGVDAILLDVGLEDLTGIEVCRRLRQRGVETPIIMVTAQVRSSDVRAALESGADDYVRKPYVVRDLLARIAAHVGGQGVVAAPQRLRRLRRRLD